MKSLLRRLWWRFLGIDQAHKLVSDFMAAFPDKCALCSYQRYGQAHGIAPAFEPLPEHPCLEKLRRQVMQ